MMDVFLLLSSDVVYSMEFFLAFSHVLYIFQDFCHHFSFYLEILILGARKMNAMTLMLVLVVIVISILIVTRKRGNILLTYLQAFFVRH